MPIQESTRRRVLAAVGGAVIAPIALVARPAAAAQNQALRNALKYQDQPKGDQQCNKCVQWIPGKSPTERGGCKVIPGDTEIAPNGWSTAYVAATK